MEGSPSFVKGPCCYEAGEDLKGNGRGGSICSLDSGTFLVLCPLQLSHEALTHVFKGPGEACRHGHMVDKAMHNARNRNGYELFSEKSRVCRCIGGFACKKKGPDGLMGFRASDAPCKKRQHNSLSEIYMHCFS